MSILPWLSCGQRQLRSANRSSRVCLTAKGAAKDCTSRVLCLSGAAERHALTLSLSVLQSEEQLSAAFSELASREAILEPVPRPTPAMREANNKAFAKGTGAREELVNHTHSGVIITRHDIKSLASRQWLNDEVMNVYMGLLQVCSLHTYILFLCILQSASTGITDALSQECVCTFGQLNRLVQK